MTVDISAGLLVDIPAANAKQARAALALITGADLEAFILAAINAALAGRAACILAIVHKTAVYDVAIILEGK